MSRSFASMLALSTLAACLAGCRPPPVNPPKPPYDGPTETMNQVVQAIDANNASITTLYSDHHFWAAVHDDRRRERKFDGDGALLYRKVPEKPDELLMTGEVITGKVFELGSTSGLEAEYWVAFMPPNEEGTEWWGHYKNLGKPGAKPVPIQPNLVTEVLGVSDVDTNFLQQPVPAMRFNNDADAYMFTWSATIGGEGQTPRWAVTKEVWFDRATKLPSKVLLFDENGRILLRAHLFNHKVIDGTEGKKIATLYELLFPDTHDKLTIELKNPKLTYKGIPKPGTIRRRPLPDVREIQIDENVK